MQKTENWAIGIVLVSTILTTTAQTLYKIGANKLETNILSIVTNVPLIVGLLLYATAAVLLIIALKGGELSVLYPIIATSYIWVTIISFTLFNESINWFKWTGVILIIGGVSFIGYGSTQKQKQVVTQ